MGYITNNNYHISNLAYVDNITLISNSQAGIIKLFNITNKFCNNIGLNVNYEKTTYTIHSNTPHIILNNQNILTHPKNESIIYLGAEFWMDTATHTPNTVYKKFQKTINFITSKKYPADLKAHLINILAILILEYYANSSQLSLTQSKKADKAIRDPIRNSSNYSANTT